MRKEAVAPEVIIAPAAADMLAAQTNPQVRSELDAAQAHRRALAEDLRLLSPSIPELPDAEAANVYELIVGFEHAYAAPRRYAGAYDVGTATYNDELFITGSGPTLMEAQHATSPVRRASGRVEKPDHGTAGLGLALATGAFGRIIIPRGLQTGNANVDPEHPIKTAILDHLGGGGYHGFLSIHGCYPGKVTGLRDSSEIHAIIGLGAEPIDASFEAAERLVEQAASVYGLRVIIGNITPHLNFAQDDNTDPRTFWNFTNNVSADEQGNPKAVRLAAAKPETTVSFVTRETEPLFLPAMQLEISRSLRLTPQDQWVRPDHSAQKIGVYMGYCLGRLATEVLSEVGRQPRS